MACTCTVGPGKFEGENALAFLAYACASLSDATTFEYGNPTDWFRAPLNFDTEAYALSDARAYGYCFACIEAASGGYPQGIHGGVALTEDSQGFVYLRKFTTREDFDAALAEAMANEDGPEDEE